MGKAKIEMKKIEDNKMRNITFHKRKRGFLKKAIELSELCGKQMIIFIWDKEKNKLVHYQSNPDFNLK
jgi:hypothetical protein